MRDSQRQRVYDAEEFLANIYDRVAAAGNMVNIMGVSLTLPPEAKFASIASVQHYCDQVTDMLGVARVQVRSRRGDTKAHYCRGEIAAPDRGDRWAMRELVVLHELAHHVTGPAHRHSPIFVGVLTDLLSRVMGPEVGLALRLINSGSVAESAR